MATIRQVELRDRLFVQPASWAREHQSLPSSEWRVIRPDAVDERLGDLSLVARVSGFGDQGTENWDRESSY